jgi:aminoglycoside phosphotransferase family enzyme/predicted kinase
MRRFDDIDQFDRLLARGQLNLRHMEELAQSLADFHQHSAAVADASMPYGEYDAVAAPIRENFVQIRQALQNVDDAEITRQTSALTDLASWSDHQLQELCDVFAKRKQQGFVRECHGDLHLQNIALINGKPTLFDCIEFNTSFRWIDVMSEVAFLLIDCDARGKTILGQQFLNRYLELTGDYDGLRVLNFYRVYRSMVRAKVATLRLRQLNKYDAAFTAAKNEYFRYIDQAKRYLQLRSGAVAITVGLSGSGKSTYAKELAQQLGWLRIRSDIERKRLSGMDALARTYSAPDQGLYNREVTQNVYSHMAKLTEETVRAGYSVIVDATFLTRAQRHTFFSLAQAQHSPWHIIYFFAPLDVCAQRVRERFMVAKDPSEADEKVLMAQVGKFEAFTPDERPYIIEVDTSKTVDMAALGSRLLAIV